MPSAVRKEAERIVGAGVTRAVRAFGGYGPSATFVLTLADGRRAFFKGVFPLPEGSAVRWMLDEEERVYAELSHLIDPWAPEYFGSLRVDGWHAVLIEVVAGERLPPWTEDQARRVVRSYASFHATTAGQELPEWLARDSHFEFSEFWARVASDDETLARISRLCPDVDGQRDARRWLDAHVAELIGWEQRLRDANRFALLHYDTRSDNVRLEGDLLRLFDWPFCCVGPPEFDFAAFAQSIAGEDGPGGEQLAAWYSEVSPLDGDTLSASLVGVSGYFADRASRPELPGLPRLRSVQRRQLKASLPWAAQRIGLPDPAWLRSVAD